MKSTWSILARSVSLFTESGYILVLGNVRQMRAQGLWLILEISRRKHSKVVTSRIVYGKCANSSLREVAQLMNGLNNALCSLETERPVKSYTSSSHTYIDAQDKPLLTYEFRYRSIG